MKNAIVFIVLTVSTISFGQSKWKDTSKVILPELKKNFNTSGTHYIKGTILIQTWARYSDLNPGSTIDGVAAGASRGDIGIRRLRIQAYGQLTDRIFFYTQFGQNNLNALTARFTGSFFHDAVTEYKVNPFIQLGGGLTGWSGMSRFSSPAVAGILGVEAPLYQQATNGINDQFVRKLSLYAKGEINHLQYRIAVSNPFSTKTTTYPQVFGANSTFSPEPPKMQTSGYLVWQFLKDKDDMSVPYLPGTYCGKKKILNLGAGWVQQNKAMWRQETNGDTIRTNLLLIGIDAFGEFPLSKKGNTLTGYLAYNNFDFGKNFIRTNGSMNPTNGLDAQGTLSGTGVSFPMIGTGTIFYGQFGYKMKNNLLGDQGTLQFYAGSQYSRFQLLKNASVMIEGGVNWLIHGNNFGKLSFGIQNRPVFIVNTSGENVVSSRKNMYVLQYQVSL